MSWSTLARVLILAALVGAAVWWVQSTANRYQDGYRAGAEATHRLRDAEALALANSIRAEAAEQARAKEHEHRETERAWRAQTDAARAAADTRLAAVARDRDRLLGRLRDAEARSQIRPAGLPEAPDAEPTLTISARPFFAAARRLIERADDAEQLNVWYGQCLASRPVD